MTTANHNTDPAPLPALSAAPAAQGLPWRVLGRSRLRSSVVGLGCRAIGGPAENLGLPMGWSTAGTDAEAVHALEAGYSGADVLAVRDNLLTPGPRSDNQAARRAYSRWVEGDRHPPTILRHANYIIMIRQLNDQA